MRDTSKRGRSGRDVRREEIHVAWSLDRSKERGAFTTGRGDPAQMGPEDRE